MSRIPTIVQRMQRAGWKPGGPITRAEVDAAEMYIGFMLPPAYREFLIAAGKTEAPTWRGLWNLQEMVSLNRSLPLFRWFEGLVGIGNEGFMVVALNYRAQEPTVVTMGMSSSDWAEVVTEAESFEEWLAGTVG